MRKISFIIAFIASGFLCNINFGLAQTNPTAYNGWPANFSFTSLSSSASSGSAGFPGNMAFHCVTDPTGGSPITTAPGTKDWFCAYNLTGRNRFLGLNANGVSMLPTSSAQFDNCSSGSASTNNFVGAVVVALNTTGRSTINVSWTGGTVTPGDGTPTPRSCALRLQYRIGTSGNFTDVPGTIQYVSSTTAGNSQSLGPTTLPAACENISNLQLRWIYLSLAANSGGSRPELRLDEITVSSSSSCTVPSISSISNNGPICAGNTLNLSVSASGTATLSYQWSGPNGFSSTNQNPSIANATTNATGVYTITVTNACGSSSSTTSSTVNALPTAAISADGPTTFCAGGSVNLTASSGASYLWSTGAITQSINVNSTGNYVVTVTNNNNCSAASSATSVTVIPVVIPSVSIGADPGNTICSGTNVTFTAVPVNGGGAPSYQWKLNGNDVGSNNPDYSNNSLNNGDLISCVMTSNANCASPITAASNTITINVTTTVTPAVSISSDAGTTVCSGIPVTFTATPANEGSTPSYQWKLNGSNVGTNSPTYLNSLLVDQDNVTCVMTSSNSCASPSTATSNALTITIVPSVIPSVSISADPSTTTCAGTNVTFTATPLNGGTPSYQWTRNGNNAGVNSNTYTNASLNNNDVIGCRMISDAICRTMDTVYASTITMTVNANPTPTISGTLSFCPGDSTLLDLGFGYSTYLWSNGATTPTTYATSGGNWTGTVTLNGCSGSTSVNVTQLNVPAQPGAFTTSSGNVFQGQNGVAYTIPNVPGVTYSWNFSGTGATINGSGNSVTVNFSSTATSGTLSVTANNSCGAGVARTISITVNLPLPLMRITEYMYNGLGTGSIGEFVEFTNTGSTTIDMTGWSFDDNSRVAGSQSLSGFGIVQPGESVVLTELSAGAFRTNWNLCNGVKVVGNNTNNLGREDEINLYDASGNLVDRLTYGDQTYSPGSIRTNLKSGWVNAAGLGNNLITQWTLSNTSDAEGSYASVAGEIGSPGKSTRATVAYDPCFVANGAPTIVMNVNTTTDYIDGGAVTSPLSPYGLSSVIADSKDPMVLYGIDFTINDDVTPVNSLVVTINSSNTNVMPNANLNLTGTGASRNLKITPVNVGYSIISVTVNDGTLSTSYTINYAASDPAPTIIPSNTAWHTGMSDGSTGIPLDSSYYIAADDELDVLNVYSRSQSGLPFVSYDYSSFLSLPNPGSPEVDVEGSANSPIVGGRMYWTGSMSNGKLPYDNKPNRDRLFATSVTGTGDNTVLSFVGYYNLRSALLAWGDANGYSFSTSAAAGVNPKGIAGFSLEGMCFGPDGTTLYLGLRAPLVPTSLRQNAVIAPILNFEAWFNNGSPSGPPAFGSPIELNLDFRGIRELTKLSNGTYIILAGSPIEDGGINNIYKWSGYASDAPVAVANDAGYILNLEGAMEVHDASGQLSLSKLQVITDGGAQVLYQDNSEAKDLGDLNLRKFRTDVLDGIDLDICSGFSAAITPSGSTTICAGNSVTLSAPTGVNNTYSWSNGATTPSVTVSAFGTYTVTVTSTTKGCSATSAPVTVSNALPSDFNGDHVTDNVDFLQLLGLFNQTCSGCAPDLNHDGNVNNVDFLILLGQFNQTCN